jgi:hypothetical protein
MGVKADKTFEEIVERLVAVFRPVSGASDAASRPETSKAPASDTSENPPSITDARPPEAQKNKNSITRLT